MDEDTYEFDIYKNVLVSDCNLFPTETRQSDSKWLYAENNKYSLFDRIKVGRWVVLVSKDSVNAAWDKIKTAVTKGELWKAEVSTSDPSEPNKSYTILVATKDYTDLDDVINVLNYLERSEIKPPNATIKYKTHRQIRTDIYRGGGQKAWMYSSDTVRPVVLTHPINNTTHNIYEFDIYNKKTVTDCNLRPTEISKCDFVWLEARNNKYADDSIDKTKIGKWVFFISKQSVDEIWNKIKMAVANGKLWASCVSTTDPVRFEEAHCVMIFTKDYTDLDDLIQVLDFLESSGIKPPNVISTYKTNESKYASICSGGRERSWKYSSFTVRSLSSTERTDDSTHNTYRFDVRDKKLVTECNLYPTDTSKCNFEWLKAVNNKYDESIDSERRGKWMFDVPKYDVDETWDAFKMAVTNGKLWYSCVSTTDPEKPGSNHTVMVYTKDFTDVDDVVRALDYLEGSEIESRYVGHIYYKTDKQTNTDDDGESREKPWKYSSKTIRSRDLIHDVYEFDVHKSKLVTDCNLRPAEVERHPPWLYAKNNKYADENVDDEKVGFWCGIVQKDTINAAWDKIKKAVANGELWSVKVDTSEPEYPKIHEIVIFTKDYTDVNDIIHVLDFLESSEIKPRNTIMTYEKAKPTNPDNKDNERSWIYSSFTIRSISLTDPGNRSTNDTYEFDIHEKKLVTDCTLYPSETSVCDFEWLHARNNKYANDSVVDDEKIGQWVLFYDRDDVDETWDEIKMAVMNGELWSSKVSTTDLEKSKGKYVVLVFTKDYTDQDDVICTLDYLKSSGIKPAGEVIKYESGLQARYSSDLNLFAYDIHEKKLIVDCNLYPSQTTHNDFVWLRAWNNKYAHESRDADKIGKWMLFLPRQEVDETWKKIKAAVTNGELWDVIVSTVDPERPKKDTHAFMIYTKDYTDVEDVIGVLNYLESSGLKHPDELIKYKTNDQSGAELFARGRERAYLYDSRTIRSTRSRNDTYKFDILRMEIVTDCDLCPSQVDTYPPWLYANNNKYPDESIILKKVGTWALFFRKDFVDSAWHKIKNAMANGELWSAKVSTSKPNKRYHQIMVYTVDYTDVNDVIKVLDYLETSGLKSPDVVIDYTEEHTREVNRAGIWYAADERPWIYSSFSIRSKGFSGTYVFDINEKRVVTDCSLHPSETSDIEWLYARNNKHADGSMDSKKVGKWMLFLPKDSVDATWDKIKMAVANDDLWFAKSSTTKANNPLYVIMVFTADYTNVNNVIKVLDYLESSGIKAPDVVIKYSKEHLKEVNGGGIWYSDDERPWLYSSSSIRSEGPGAYEFDIHEKKLVTDCSLYPSEVRECDFKWLHAKNNQYDEESLDSKKVGKWMLFLQEDKIDTAWYEIKMAVAAGKLWSAKVSTTKSNNPFYSIMVYTVDFTDVNDVIKVLDYLESSGIKARDVIIKYTEEHTHLMNRGRPWLYLSNTIRKNVSWR